MNNLTYTYKWLLTSLVSLFFFVGISVYQYSTGIDKSIGQFKDLINLTIIDSRSYYHFGERNRNENSTKIGRYFDINSRRNLIFIDVQQEAPTSEYQKANPTFKYANITTTSGKKIVTYTRTDFWIVYGPTIIMFIFTLWLTLIILHKITGKHVSNFNNLFKALSKPNERDSSAQTYFKLLQAVSRAPQSFNDLENAVKQIIQLKVDIMESEEANQIQVDENQKIKKNLSVRQLEVERAQKEIEQAQTKINKTIHEISSPLSATSKQLNDLFKYLPNNLYAEVSNLKYNIDYIDSTLQTLRTTNTKLNNIAEFSSFRVRTSIEHSFLMASLGAIGGKGCNMSDFQIDISCEGFKHLPNLVTDEFALKTVFVNLFKNSLKYSYGTKIYVKVEVVYDGESDTLTTNFSVIDSGKGFPSRDEKLTRLHNKNNKSDFNSFGMGLQIVEENLNKLKSTLITSNMKDEYGNTTGAHCSFSITTDYSNTIDSIYPDACHVALYTTNKTLKNNITKLFQELMTEVSYIADDSLEISSECNLIVIDYDPNSINEQDLRGVAETDVHHKVILLCDNAIYEQTQMSGILNPWVSENQEGEECTFNNIFAITKPVLSQDIIRIAYVDENKPYLNESFNKAKVLIIEDYLPESTYLRDLIQHMATISVATTIESAIQSIQQNVFQLIITDYNINGRTCPEILPFINCNTTRTIVHSGQDFNNSIIDGMDQFDSIVRKSTNYSQLTFEIAKLLNVNVKKVRTDKRKGLNKLNIESYKEILNSMNYSHTLTDNPTIYKDDLHKLCDALRNLNVESENLQEIIEMDSDTQFKRGIDHDKTLQLLIPYELAIENFLSGQKIKKYA